MKTNKTRVQLGERKRGFLWHLARANYIKRFIPDRVKTFLKSLLPTEAYRREQWAARDEYADVEEISSYPAKVDVRLGIIKEFAHCHKYYVGACRDMGVPYKLLDISGPDWIDVISKSGCDGFLVWPSAEMTVWKQMYDERLRVICEDMGKVIYPEYQGLWVYESKRRMHYWLKANGFEHPQTWVFYDRDEALDFASRVELPIVYKIDLGSAASGVRIFHRRSCLLRFVKRCFGKGFVRTKSDPRDKQWGSVLFQEYLPDAAEWRMIRVGESYFGYEKVKVGDFHSGSHVFSYFEPSSEILDFTRMVTDRGNFRSMDIDIFVTSDRKFVINELQAVFALHASEGLPMVDGKPGRMVYDSRTLSWRFEEGNFCDNLMCNLRVQDFLRSLGKIYG